MHHCKKNILLPLILLCFLLSACTSTPSTIPPTESLPTETVPETLPFDFPLPPEYTARYKTNDEISIILNDQIIGGIIRTGFSSDCATEAKSEERRIYLVSLSSRPVRNEYFAMLWDNRAYVSMSFENIESGETWEQSHCLFAVEDISFDIWVDDELIDTEQRDILVDYVVNQ